MRLVIIYIIISIFLCACNNADKSSFFPLSVGNQWIYDEIQRDSSGTQTFVTTVSVINKNENDEYTLSISQGQNKNTEETKEYSDPHSTLKSESTFKVRIENGRIERLAGGSWRVVLDPEGSKRPEVTLLAGIYGWNYMIPYDTNVTVPYGSFTGIGVEASYYVSSAGLTQSKESRECFVEDVGLVYYKYEGAAAYMSGMWNYYSSSKREYKLRAFKKEKIFEPLSDDIHKWLKKTGSYFFPRILQGQ